MRRSSIIVILITLSACLSFVSCTKDEAYKNTIIGTWLDDNSNTTHTYDYLIVMDGGIIYRYVPNTEFATKGTYTYSVTDSIFKYKISYGGKDGCTTYQMTFKAYINDDKLLLRLTDADFEYSYSYTRVTQPKSIDDIEELCKKYQK